MSSFDEYLVESVPQIYEFSEWTKKGYLISVSYYSVDAMWYVIAKRHEGDPGIRSRDTSRRKAIEMMVDRLKMAREGDLYGQERLYGNCMASDTF